MQYNFTCPVPNCGHTTSVEAESDDMAVERLVATGRMHNSEIHPAEPQTSDEEMGEAIRSGMHKDEHSSY